MERLENLKTEKEKISLKQRELADQLESHREREVELRNEKRSLLTEAALGSEPARIRLKQVESEFNSARSEIEDITMTLLGLEEKEVEVDKLIRISEQSESEAEYLKALENLFEFCKKITEVAGQVVIKLDELDELAHKFPRQRQSVLSQLQGYTNFLSREGVEAISERLSAKSLAQDTERLKAVEKKLTEIAGLFYDIAVSNKIREVAAFLDSTPITVR